MVAASLKNHSFRFAMYEKLFVFSFMGETVNMTEFPQFLDMLEC